MRVAIIAQSARSSDAVGNQVAARLAFFRERGAEVLLFVQSDRDLHPELPAVVRAADESVLAELGRCDLVIVDYSQHYPLLDVLPSLFGRGPRVLFDYHGVTPPDLWHGPKEALRDGLRRRAFVWFADEALVHSRYMQRELCRATGYPAERVHLLPLWSTASRPGSTDWRTRLGLTTEPLVLFVGRLAPNKRVPVLIEAMARLHDLRPSAHLAIVGDAGDVYRRELETCRELVGTLDLTSRVHFLGRLTDSELADIYRAANLFVMPSIHEGCCIPVREAMAAGVPVIAARATALPETIAGAGLSFAPDDSDDLARQMRRVLQPAAKSHGNKVAIVASAFGPDVLGGAETSLRRIAIVLHQSGRHVEVFTSGPGPDDHDGIPTHRFPTKPAIESAHRAGEAIEHGSADDNTIAAYFAHSRSSPDLLAELARRQDEFAAIVVGPYCSPLAWEASQIAPDRTVLMPCFHDEPLARHPAMARHYTVLGGLLYHSEAERRLAECDLGVHHPNAAVLGTILESARGRADAGRALVASAKPYLLYSGRYCRQKNLLLLIDWLTRFEAEHPDRFHFVFIGDGNVPIPNRPSWRDLGFVSEQSRADLMAGAAALIQLSTRESLSLAVLEAWSEGTPVIGHAACEPIADHVHEAGGGELAGSYAEFRDHLTDLHTNPERWHGIGASGLAYVSARFVSPNEYASSLASILANLGRPLAEQMRERGMEVAARHDATAWRRAFSERVESVLHREATEPCRLLDIQPRTGPTIRARVAARRIAVRLVNTGNVPILPTDRLQCQIVDANQRAVGESPSTTLTDILLPGASCSVMLKAEVPGEPGAYFLRGGLVGGPLSDVPLMVHPKRHSQTGNRSELMDDVAARLAEAEALAELPDGYTDVSEGKFASLRRAIKKKLLHQFQTSYVDVLARQQSVMNKLLLSVIQELAECTDMLGQSPDVPADDLHATIRRLKTQSQATARRVRDLEQRLATLEKCLHENHSATTAEPEGQG